MRRLRRVFLGLVSILVFAARGQTALTRTEMLQHAAALIQRGDLSAAENELAALLNQAPDDPLALNLLGLLRLQQHNFDEAAKLFQKAIQPGHKIAGPHINLAIVYGANRPFEAIAQLGEALAIAPGNEQAISALRQIAKDSSLAAMQKGEKDQAINVLLKAQTILPHDPELLYDSGLIEFECGSYGDADRSLTEALKLRSDYPQARYALARAYLAESLAKPAEDEMRKYLAERPNDATAQYGLGYILMAEQQVDEAKTAFQKSLALQPNQTESIYQLGEIASQQGQTDSARDDYHKVIALDPHHGGALTGLGVLAYRAAQYDEAKAWLEQAIAAAPTYQKAHYYYALTLSRLGQKSEADHEFTVARSLQKEHGGEHHLLAAQP